MISQWYVIPTWWVIGSLPHFYSWSEERLFVTIELLREKSFAHNYFDIAEPILTFVPLLKKFAAFYENQNFRSSGIMYSNVSNASPPSPVHIRMSNVYCHMTNRVHRCETHAVIMKDELEIIWKTAVGYCPNICLEQLNKP